MHCAHRGSSWNSVIVNNALFEQEYVGCVFRIITLSSYDYQVYIIKHEYNTASLISHCVRLAYDAPQLRVTKLHKYFITDHQIYDRLSSYHVLNNASLLWYTYFTQPEWVSVRHTIYNQGFSCTVMHANICEPHVRNLSYFNALSYIPRGNILLLEPASSDISTFSIVMQYLQLELWLSVSRSDEYEYASPYNCAEHLYSWETTILEPIKHDSDMDEDADELYDRAINIEQQLCTIGFIYDRNVMSIQQIDFMIEHRLLDMHMHIHTMYTVCMQHILWPYYTYVYTVSMLVYIYNTYHLSIKCVYSNIIATIKIYEYC